MPIKMGDKTYSEFDDASKAVQSSKGLSEDRANAYVATIDRKQNKGEEQTPEQVASLTTPDAGDVKTEEPKDLTSPPTSSKEADNPNVDTESPQDQAEDPANPQQQDKPANEEEEEDKLEYNGETYHKVKAIEYEDEIYVQKDDKEEAEEDDLEYEDRYWEKADEDTLELENDNDYYIKDEEQAPMDTDLSGGTATPAIDIPELNPIGESVIIKENGRYRKYNVFQANEQEDDDEKMEKLRAMKEGAKEQEDLPVRKEEDYKKPEDEFKDERREEHQGQASEQEEVPVEKPAEVPDQPPVEIPQGDVAEKPEEPKVEPIEQKIPSEEIRAVEKIIIKENGKLKFKKVFTEVKKKA